MANTTRIAIIGAGNVGGNLGQRLAATGFPVRFGARDPGADEVKKLLAECKGDAGALPVADAAAWGEVVFLAVPANVAVDIARSNADALAGRVVVDCNNPLTWNAGPVWAPPAQGSLAAAIAEAAPRARVVKGFNTFGAEHHKDPTHAGNPPANVFLAGDDAAAKQLVTDVARAAGFSPVDAGPLRNAAVLENVAMLWIHLAMAGGQGRDFVLNMQRAR